MTAVAALVLAVGVLLFVSGLPTLRKPGLEQRVEFYVSGLHGHPSKLLGARTSGATGVRGWVESRVGRFLPATHGTLEQRLIAAGNGRGGGSFRIEQLIWGVTASAAVWILVPLGLNFGVAIDARVVPVTTAIAFSSGWLGRDWWLSKQIEERRAVLQEELPAAIDLVALSIMSGESVAAAFARVASVLGTGLGGEFDRVVSDMRAGAPVTQALEAMKERLPAAGIARFVDALITGIERGSPLAEVLRAQADDGREARRRQLLELGGKREVLMLIPVVFLIMPTVIAFASYPVRGILVAWQSRATTGLANRGTICPPLRFTRVRSRRTAATGRSS
ncbi:MAG: type II secretion system F family protein [Actinobacteria bacterium]|nr:type II secretion system F family protein [Actinomycetota bacterium]